MTGHKNNRILKGESYVWIRLVEFGKSYTWAACVDTSCRKPGEENKNWIIISIASLSACGISLCMQIFYTDYLVKIEDWSALMDTSGAVAFVSTVLLAVTIILNAIAVVKLNKKSQ
ncbi:hypothetical protein OXPF_29180 [Oxobacter pfennigii]|uniref:Uncharacterized protein n=1 Tax=Oxobacter pfennigii TaxID=36849 RepID=A0A0P8W664_9CLOT|nr:hypothetical protein [Oxobacter pfennigii]KPU43477.1 hypothetical protein OXPF_29180 [Oxobacter pfennigii]